MDLDFSGLTPDTGGAEPTNAAAPKLDFSGLTPTSDGADGATAPEMGIRSSPRNVNALDFSGLKPADSDHAGGAQQDQQPAKLAETARTDAQSGGSGDKEPEHSAVVRGFMGGLLEQNPRLLGETLEGLSHLAPGNLGKPLRSVSESLIAASKTSPEYAMREQAPSFTEGARRMAEAPKDLLSGDFNAFYKHVTRNIKDAGHALSWAGEAMGQGVASTIPSVVTGAAGAAAGSLAGPGGAAVGGIAGALVPSYALNYGDVYQSLKEEGVAPKTAAKYAAAAAVPMAALDVVTPTRIAGKLVGVGEVRRSVAQTIAKRIAKEGLADAGLEGITEGAQQAVQNATKSIATGKPFATKENFEDITANAVAGALTGVVMGGATAVMPPERLGDLAAQAAAEAPATASPQSKPGEELQPAAPPPGPQITPEDIKPGDEQSPIPTDLIAAGRAKIRESAQGVTQPPAEAAPSPVEEPAAASLQANQPDAESAWEPLYDTDSENQIGWHNRTTGDVRGLESAPVAEAPGDQAQPAQFTPEKVTDQTDSAAAPPSAAQFLEMGHDAASEQAPEDARTSPEAAPAPQTEGPAETTANPAEAGTGEQAAAGKPLLKANGTPFASEKSALVAARQRPDMKGRDMEAVAIDGGWGLRERQGGEQQFRVSPSQPATQPAKIAPEPAPTGVAEPQQNVRQPASPQVKANQAAAQGDNIPTQPENFIPANYTRRLQARVRNTRASLAPEAIAKDFGITTDQALRALSHLAANREGGVVIGPKGVRRAPISKGPIDVATFIARTGGVRNNEGHDLIKGRGLQRFIPGAGPMIRPGGKSVDALGEALWEAGYFGPTDATPRPTENDVLQLLEKTAGGQKIYSPEDAAAVGEARAGARAQEDEAAARSDIADIASGMNEQFSANEINEIVGLMGGGMDAQNAVVEYVERQAIRTADDLAEETGNPDHADIPFDTQSEPQGSDREAGARQQRPEGEQKNADESGAHGTDASQTAGKIQSEPGAEGLPQTIIPGAEQSARQLAQARETSGSGKAKAKVPQKDVGGLFAQDEPQSADLFDNPPDTQPKTSRASDSIERTAIRRAASDTEGVTEKFARRTDGAERVHGVPREADPPISSHTSAEAIKSDPDYRAAKSGDMTAALRLVARKVAPQTLAEAARRFGGDVSYVPVHAEEASGKNAIPAALALRYAEAAGAQVETGIVQSNRVYHTGAGPMERMLARPVFDGAVTPGRRYVLVDDVSVLGGSLAGLADHIRAGGGEVAGVVTLANASRSGVYAPKSSHVSLVEKRFGNIVRNEFGIAPSALTADEAHYLANFRNADALRSAITKARSARENRLRAKGIKPEQVNDGAAIEPPSSSQNTSDANAHVEGKIALAFSPEFRKARADVAKRLRERLDGLGLKKTAVRVADRILLADPDGNAPIDGYYQRKLITIALDSASPDFTLDHEAIHAMRSLGLFTDAEWRILSGESRKAWVPRYDVKNRYVENNAEKNAEEGVAFAFMDWRAERGQQSGFAKRIFQRVRDILDAVRNVLAGNGFDTVERIFARIESGAIGSRTAGEPATAAPRFSRQETVAERPAAQTNTPQFRRWFGESKVVDENGEPLRVFHGTPRGELDIFDTYASNYGLMGQGSYFTEDPAVASSYTGKDVKRIERQGGTPERAVYPVYLSIKNPLDMAAPADRAAWAKAFPDHFEAFDPLPKGATNEQAYRNIEEALQDEQIPTWEGAEQMQDGIRTMGYDGITHIGGGRVGNGPDHRVWIAFEPEQVKSAIGNRGTFDPNDARISFARRKVTTEPLVGTKPSEAEPSDSPSLAGNINLDNINSSDDVKALLQATADANNQFETARRGTITHEETRELANMAGVNVNTLGARKRGQAFNAEQSLAARNLLAQSAKSLVSLAERATGGSDADVYAFQKALTRHVAIQEQVSGITAEAGRALSSFRIQSVDTDRAKALKNIIEQSGGRNKIEEMADLVRRLGTPEQIGLFTRKAYAVKASDVLLEAWINGLLSGPTTHVVNASSNLLNAIMAVPETAVASAFGTFRRGDRVYARESTARLYGILQGAADGVRVAAAAFVTEDPSDASLKLEARKYRAIPSVKLRKGAQKLTVKGVPVPFTGELELGGKQVRLPGRLLLASDEFFKALARRQEINAQAVRKALREKLSGRDLVERVTALQVNPTADMQEAAKINAAHQTFTDPVGEIGASVQRMTKAAPVMKLIFPFIRTPINIVKYAAERTPAAVLFKDMRANLLGRNGAVAQDTARARILIGSSVGMAAMSLAAQGLLSGGAPDDRKKRELLYAQGWQPYSIKIGGTWYSYSRVDPLATILGISADAVQIGEAIGTEDAGKIAALIAGAVANDLTSKTYLRGLSDAISAIQDPERYGEYWVQSMTGTLVPTGVAQYTRSQDPYIREAHSILDSLKARLPGYSETLFPKRDIFGEPVKRERGALPSILNPIYQRTETHDAVAAELQRLEMGVPSVPKKVLGVKLTEAQHDELEQFMGRLTKRILTPVITAPRFHRLPDEAQREILKTLIEAARKRARAMLAARHPEIRQAYFSQKIARARAIAGQ